MKKEQYEVPIIEVIEFATEDVITTSKGDVADFDIDINMLWDIMK